MNRLLPTVIRLLKQVMAAPSLDHIHPNALTYNFNDNSVFGMIKFNLDMMTYSMGEEEKKAKEGKITRAMIVYKCILICYLQTTLLHTPLP